MAMNPVKLFRAAFFAALLFVPSQIQAETFDSEARQAILIDATNDSVLYSKNPDAAFAPASLAKLMTLAVAFNEIKHGRLSPETEFVMTEHAWRTGGAPARTTTMFARPNSRVTVRDLLRGIAIVVANDGAIALAEGVAKSESEFAERMNRYAKEIGLNSSSFVNPTGLPQEGQRTTVRDLGRLMQHIISNNPDLYSVFGEPDLDYGGIKQQNRNPLYGNYSGMDGGAIGSVAGDGHMIVVSAVRNGKRLIAVLTGLADEKARTRAATALLDWGFNAYIDREIFNAGDVVASAQVFGGTQGSVKLVTQANVTLPVPKDGNSRIVARVVYRGPVKAPVKVGDRVGALRIWRDNLLQSEVPLVASETVEEGTLWLRALDATYELLAGPLHSLRTRFLVPA